MNIAMKIMFFSICLNLATGTMFQMFPEFEDNGATSGFGFNSTYQDFFNETMAPDVQPIEQTGSGFFNSIIDMLDIGWMNSLKLALNRYMFGFVDLLNNVFGGWFGEEEAFRSALVGGFKTFIVIAYIVVIIDFITGKNLFGGGSN